MKKIFLLCLLLVASVGAYAQKSYVNVCSGGINNDGSQNIYLSGAVPNDMKSYYDGFDDNVKIGDILNMLAGRGFVVEQMSCCNGGSTNGTVREVVILSKSGTSSSYTEGDVNKDGEVTIADVNKVINIILGVIRENPSLLEQIKD